jgi:uncharacterized protein (DUF433 family)
LKAVKFPGRIDAKGAVMMAKPYIKGKRIPVDLLLEKMAALAAAEVVLAEA